MSATRTQGGRFAGAPPGRWHHEPMTHAHAVPETYPQGRPVQVVAHRGASEDVPEHTLAAYRKAIEDGADALECDIRLTADGELVCVHDWRVNRTSNGRGAVSSLELADLAALDFGSWKGRQSDPETPERYDLDERSRVLTLRRLLELVVDTDRRVELAIETKHPTRWAGQVEERLIDLLRHFGLDRPDQRDQRNRRDRRDRSGPSPVAPTAAAPEGSPTAWPIAADTPPAPQYAPSQVRVMSFSSRSLRRVHLSAPALPTVYLMQYVLPRHRDGRLPAGVRIAGPGMRIIRANPGYVARLHRAGNQVHVWTVDDPADVELCARLGVDALITNRPRQVIEQLSGIEGLRR